MRVVLSSLDHFFRCAGSDLFFVFCFLLGLPEREVVTLPVEECDVRSSFVFALIGNERLLAHPTTKGSGSGFLLQIGFCMVHCSVGCTDILPASCPCPGTSSDELVGTGGELNMLLLFCL